MSCWTYVDCVVKLPDKVNIEEIFGKEFRTPSHPDYSAVSMGKMSREEFDKLFDRYMKVLEENYEIAEKDPESFLPIGSEGSLHYSKPEKINNIWIYGIHGSLRDVCNAQAIVDKLQHRFLCYLVHSHLECDEYYAKFTASDGVGEWIFKIGDKKFGKKVKHED